MALGVLPQQLMDTSATVKVSWLCTNVDESSHLHVFNHSNKIGTFPTKTTCVTRTASSTSTTGVLFLGIDLETSALNGQMR